VQSIGGTPPENLIIDSIEMPRVQGCNYLLVFFCTFSGWMEALPMWTEKAQEVARCLLKEIIPQIGIPVSTGSRWYSTWKLIMAYCPQSSGKV
jgi:hypothetical protein